jgi:NAD(P)-dependent dehydrogenase (short-subunit alcohol dehydrogenase family)
VNGKVVLITGADGGLGVAVTQRFLASGATVIGASRKITAAAFSAPNFVALPVDFTQPQAVLSAIDSLAAKLGKLDALIHVLGGFAGGASIADTDDATWRQMLDLNLNGAFYAFRAAIPHLRKTGAGRIVAVGSLTAVEPHANLGAYVVSKAALVTLVRTVALENARYGLTANVVLPGTMDTPGNRKSMPSADFSKWLKTTDVAEVIFLLASDQASQITGATIPLPEKG